jgi:TonB-dependent receptor
VRYEDAEQNVVTGNRFPPDDRTGDPVLLENAYWLPAATVTWNFADDLQLRLGYSQTIARPQFRELAVSSYIDPDTGRNYAGNPFLEDSTFDNYDARIEYYFGRGQFVTAGAFYKTIDKPIEEVVIVDPSGSGTLTRFINAPEAELYGAEVEYRTKFDSPFEVPFLEGVAWLFAANYTYTHSEVNGQEEQIRSPIPPFNTDQAFALGINDGTPLQGTPENIANLQLGLETPQTQLTLLVGWVDERILRRGIGSVPSVQDRPGVNVDLVYRRTFDVNGAEFTLGVSGRNLLDEQHEEFQMSDLGRTDVNTYDRGRSFSLSLGTKF